MTRAAAALGILAGLLTAASPTAAQGRSLVDEGRELYESGDLGGALDRLIAAEARDDLTRDDLIRLLETRILIHHVRNDASAVATDLRALVGLAPERPASEEFPPEVRDEMTRIRGGIEGPVRVRSDVRQDGDGVIAVAEVVSDPARLTRVARIHVRQEGERVFRSREGRITLRGATGTLEHYAQAIGPGGVVLATDGDAGSPLTFVLSGAEDDEEDDGWNPWPLAGTAIGVAVAAAIAVAVVLVVTSDGANRSRISGPMERPEMP